jgi:peptidoglycan hydrolase-like protein with peptidoglycan-binding domain
MKRRTKVTTSVLAAMAVSVTGVGLATRSGASATTNTSTSTSTPTEQPSAASSTKKSTKVERRKLTEEDRYDGTLKFKDKRNLTAPAGASGSGTSKTVTKIVDKGATLQRGDVAYELDANPTVVMYGDQPMYRSLSDASSVGTDIRQLEENLVNLGYDPDGSIVVDNTFDGNTAAAVKEWEQDLGVETDGVIDQSDVLFLPGSVVVSDTKVGVGEAINNGSPLMDVIVTEQTANVVSPVDGEVGNVNVEAQPAAGSVLYEVDDVPVVTLIGGTPITRDLAEGDTGTDVELLQENLVAMGYTGDGDNTSTDTSDCTDESSDDSTDDTTPSTDNTSDDCGDTTSGDSTSDVLEVNGDFDAATLSAVKEMQFSVGQEVDGKVNRSEVAVIPQGYSIIWRFDTSTESDNEVEINTNEQVLGLQRTERVVEVEVDLADQSKLSVGTKVRIAIPGTEDASGTVRSVSSVATNGGGDGTAVEDTTVTVTIAVDLEITIDQVETPVDVYVERILADDVLVVPVAALVSLSEGGFAVELTGPSGGSLVKVETGEYADNFVEITGDGIVEGVEVKLP